MDIEKIKSGRPKPQFVLTVEWVSLGTISLFVLVFLASQVMGEVSSLVLLLAFILMIETGLLAVFYGVEGIKYGFIWITYPTPSGPKRLGFNGIACVLVGAAYVIMGLGFMITAILFAYLNGTTQ